MKTDSKMVFLPRPSYAPFPLVLPIFHFPEEPVETTMNPGDLDYAITEHCFNLEVACHSIITARIPAPDVWTQHHIMDPATGSVGTWWTRRFFLFCAQAVGKKQWVVYVWSASPGGPIAGATTTVFGNDLDTDRDFLYQLHDDQYISLVKESGDTLCMCG